MESEDDEAWTRISGPSDDEMSVSDDSLGHSTTQCQTPKVILDAEKATKHHPSGSLNISDLYQRYTGAVTLLCKETATQDADPHIQEGLAVAVDTAASIRLNESTAHDDDCDVYAFALVIHVWQIVCFRMQHGSLPSADIDVSLCLNLTTYFLSAHAIVENYCTVSSEKLRCAVQYWENRLKLMGQGNRWMEDRWTTTVQHVDQEKVVYRNETADRYLKALENDGKEGLTISIIEQETKGGFTQLYTMIQQSPDAEKKLRRQIASMLYSMDPSLLKAMIQGQLPRLAKVRSRSVYRAIKELNEQDFIQPGTYMTCICDHVGLSPTPHQWQRVCEQMLKYVQIGGEHNNLAQQIDQQLHPKSSWPKELARKGLRRYTEWQSYMEKGTHTPDSVHRHWVKYFVKKLQKRIKGQPIHAPLAVPVIEVGFSNDPRKRLRQHRHHESSNYLMNLAEAIFETEYPGAFQLEQMIVFACYRPIQPWLSLIIVAQLAQGFVERGAVVSHDPIGQLHARLNSTVPAGIWAQFEDRVYEDGRFAREVEANTRRLQARKKARVQAEEQRTMMLVKQSLVERPNKTIRELLSIDHSLMDERDMASVAMTQLMAETSGLRLDFDTNQEELEAQTTLISQENPMIHNLEAADKSVLEVKANDEMILLKTRISTLASELKMKINELHSKSSIMDSKDEEYYRLEAGYLKAHEEAHFDRMSLQAAPESVDKRVHALEAEYKTPGRRPLTPEKRILHLGGPSTSSVGLSISKTASRPPRTTNATVTPSDSVAFTLSVRDAKLLNLSSDVLPIDILRTLRNKLRIWKVNSKNSWATVQSSKKSRSCIITRLERKKSQWNDGHEYACAMCEKRMRLCVVVDSAERILLLPRKVAEDEGRGPTDTKYWTR